VSAIADAGAAQTHGARHHSHYGFYRYGPRHGLGLARGAVHGELVVPNGTGFATVTFDRGTVKSVSGNTLTVTDGTRTKTYKDVTLTIPAGAAVRNNGATASLSDLKAGERVVVVQGPKHTWVIARTPRSAPAAARSRT
jgi:GTPase involved in cell partitioning and DNA repair